MIILVTITLFLKIWTFTTMAINSLLTSCCDVRVQCVDKVQHGCDCHDVTINLHISLI